MNKVLVVDDDALVLECYRRRFSSEGFDVDVAVDGVAAVKALRATPPDVVILDLMMPRLSGVEVLKFIRTDKQLKDTLVIVLTNCFMGEMIQSAKALGIHGAVLKAECNPTELIKLTRQALENGKTPIASAPAATPGAAPPTSQPIGTQEVNNRAPDALTELRATCQAFIKATDSSARTQQLSELYRQARKVTAIAGFAERPLISLFTGAFEAFLFEMCAKPAAINPSVLRTVVSGVDFIGVLFERFRDPALDSSLRARVMTVDDDPLANRITVEAMQRAYLECSSFEDPLKAMRALQASPYDLVLLDIEMPGMKGFEFCQQLRKLPGYARTPVVYVTGHADFDNRAKGILSGGDDLIAKPILPMELAVKVVLLILRNRLIPAR